MTNAIFRFSRPSTIVTLLVVRTAVAAPNTLLISETPSCRVSLSKVSYEGPGADDEEFVELIVDRLVTGSGGAPLGRPDARPQVPAPPPPPPCNTSHDPSDAGIHVPDANAPTDARPDVPSGKPTLGDCGLGELRLVNGGAGACDEYRVIPLGSVLIPDDGFVVLCAQDSLFPALCDVDTAGRSALRNGFLQNGPTDGLRFLDASGMVALEVAYEGIPTCFSPGAYAALGETGELLGAPGIDDVNVVCGNHFELAPISKASLRTPNRCDASSAADSGDAATPLEATAPVDSGAGFARPEFAPDVGAGYRTFSVPDADLELPPKAKGPPLEPPSCRTTPGRGPSDAFLPGIVVAAALFRRRTRRPSRHGPRAGCSARFWTALRRSP
jgi:hypothetical protein